MTLRATHRLILVPLLASTLMVACGNPCTEIAVSACATAGSDSEECQRLEKLAARASAEDRRACEVALNLVDSLEKVQ